MPIPERESGEDKDKFVSRCISSIIDEYGQEQASAICYNKAEEKMSKSTSKEEIEVFVLKPRKNENRGLYLSRCGSNRKMRDQFPNNKERAIFCLTSFNSYYKWWSKLEEFGDIPIDSALGECIANERAKGADYRKAYAACSTKVVAPNTTVVLSEEDDDDNLILEPVLGS